MILKLRCSRFAPYTVWIVLAFFCLLPAKAEFTRDLNSPVLEREFDWAMFVDTQPLKRYLNYSGSRLHPLAKVRVNIRSILRTQNRCWTKSEIYEDLWYHEGTPLGLKRQRRLNMTGNEIGAIVVGSVDNDADYTATITNVLIRLMLDLQLREANLSAIVVPQDLYDGIATQLRFFRFFPESEVPDDPPVVHLRAYPGNKDGYFYYSRRP